MLKKPQGDVFALIAWWTKLDDTIHLMRNKKAIRMWERKGIPHIAVRTPQGEWCGGTIRFIDGKGRNRCLKYDELMVNRYWYTDCFEKDDYRRISKVFEEVLKMGM